MAERVEWIEVVVSMSCNCRCTPCPSGQASAAELMDGHALASTLRQGRRLGARHVWFGGGEPTLHPELLRAAAFARQQGYRRIRLQTNALRLAYAPYVDALVAAGFTEVAFSVKGASADTHDAITRTPRSFDLLCQGIGNVVARGVRAEADVLVTASSTPELADAVVRFSRLGIQNFSFWLVSTHGQAKDNPVLPPRLDDIQPHLSAAFDAADRHGVAATTLHTPPCTLPPHHRDRYVHSGSWNLLVFTPGRIPFRAEDSAMEGGTYVAACASCKEREYCLGLRHDYLETHGDGEIHPLLPSR